MRSLSPLNFEMGWIEELWSNTILLRYENKEEALEKDASYTFFLFCYFFFLKGVSQSKHQSILARQKNMNFM